MNDYLSQDQSQAFEKSKEDKPSNYFKMKDDGQFKFRIMSKPQNGWLWWVKGTDKPRVPVRVKYADAPEQVPAEALPNEYNPDKYISEFWGFAIWNYQEKRIQIAEFTQSTIFEPLLDLVQNEDWGDPRHYDIVITRKTENIVKYTVQASPPSEVPEEATKAFENTPIDWEKWYDGDSPFGESVDIEAVDKIMNG